MLQQAEGPRLFNEAPSQLILTQPRGGGFQITSNIQWALGGLKLTLNNFINTKSWILTWEVTLELFLTKEEAGKIKELEEETSSPLGL